MDGVLGDFGYTNDIDIKDSGKLLTMLNHRIDLCFGRALGITLI